MNELEIVGATLGLINVYLIIRRSLWNYPFGIAMVVIYGAVFVEARLYAEAVLQAYFLLIQVYGWWNWVQRRDGDGLIIVETMTTRDRLVTCAAIIPASFAVGALMSSLTNAAAPYWDAFTAGMSVVAQFLLSRRKLESWALWILVDVLSIGLFWSRGLSLTAGLYAVFLAMAIAGLLQWIRALRLSPQFVK